MAAASTGPPGHRPTLTGAGSTFDAPFFAVAFASYQQQHPGVTIGYSAVGSSAGIAAFSAGQVDFGASDVPMTAREQAAAKGGPITQVPVALGGEGVAYNLSLPGGRPAAPDRPGARRDLPRADHPLERPGHRRPQPRRDPPACGDHRRAPLRRQRHHLHLQQLPLQRRPGLGLQGRHRQDAQLAGRGRRRRQRRGGHRRCTAPRSPSATSSRPTPRAWCCRSPPSATRPGTTSSRPPRPSPPTPPRNPASRPTDFSIVNQPGASSYPISGYSWALVYTRQSEPGHRPGPGYHAGLAHP